MYQRKNMNNLLSTSLIALLTMGAYAKGASPTPTPANYTIGSNAGDDSPTICPAVVLVQTQYIAHFQYPVISDTVAIQTALNATTGFYPANQLWVDSGDPSNNGTIYFFASGGARLGPGTFYVNNLSFTNTSYLRGTGPGTILVLTGSLLVNAPNVTISDLTIVQTSGVAIQAGTSATGLTVKNVNLSGFNYGINSFASTTIDNCTFQSSTQNAIAVLLNAPGSVGFVRNCTFQNSQYGIYLNGATFIRVDNVEALNVKYPVTDVNGSDNQVQNSSFWNCAFGVYYVNCGGNLVNNNNVVNATSYGMISGVSRGNIFKNNVIRYYPGDQPYGLVFSTISDEYSGNSLIGYPNANPIYGGTNIP